MTHNRKPISLLASVALGLGAALLILLVGGHPAAAAPGPVGDSQPAPVAQCYARNDSATLLVYSSADSAAMRQAVLAALPNDTTRLAGTCAGVAAGGGTTQTVLINKVLTLVGGYSISDWAHSYPITQPTTLDAQSQGRVITTSAELTISALTVQNGQSFGGDGGGIYAGSKFTSLGAVNFLSNTTLVSTTVNVPRTPNTPPSGSGGGLIVKGQATFVATASPSAVNTFVGNSAAAGGGAYFEGPSDLSNVQFSYNLASTSGGGLDSPGTLHMTNVQVDHNSAFNGGGIYTRSGATLQYINCLLNIATYGGGCWAAISENQVNGNHLMVTNNRAAYGAGADFYQVLAIITLSRFENNTASIAGGAIASIDSSDTLDDDAFDGNVAPEGDDQFAEWLFAPFAPVETDEYDTFDYADFPSLAGRSAVTTAGGNPLASSTVLSRSAFSATGATIFLTNTIISGYSLDLETSQSGTIGGNYNLFGHTPVISGTNITTGTHSIVGNPMFADALGHLSAGSPAIDHGIDVGINVDLDGNHRPSGAGFDIGAYEFQAAVIKLFLPLVRR